MKINTLFSGTFFLFQYDFIQKSPFLVENAWEHRMFTTMEKMDLILKTPLAKFNMQMHRRKRLRMNLIFPRLSTFFSDIISSGLKFCDLIS